MATSTKTFGVIYFLKRQKAKGNNIPIYLRITVDGRRREFSIKRSVLLEKWDLTKGMAKGKSDDIGILNSQLERIKGRVVNCYQELLTSNKSFTVDDVKNKFVGVQDEEITLMQLFDYHNMEMRNILEWGTLKNYFTTKKYFKLYLKDKHKRDDIHLSLLKYNFLIEFICYMKECRPINSYQPCNHNTIMKHIERFRKLITLAVRNEWIEKDPFLKFKRTIIKKEIGYLSEGELNRLRKKKFMMKRIELVQDLFVFACYTGLSYIDIQNLTEENIIIGIDGNKWISTRRKKTDYPVRIPILPEASDIITKYKNSIICQNKGTLLPPITNQKLNSYLKEIADICAIHKNLTFHMARHTFATTVTLSKGIPIETVSKLLGHSKIKTTQIYARVLEEKISKDIQVLMKLSEVDNSSKQQNIAGI